MAALESWPRSLVRLGKESDPDQRSSHRELPHGIVGERMIELILAIVGAWFVVALIVTATLPIIVGALARASWRVASERPGACLTRSPQASRVSGPSSGGGADLPPWPTDVPRPLGYG